MYYQYFIDYAAYSLLIFHTAYYMQHIFCCDHIFAMFHMPHMICLLFYIKLTLAIPRLTLASVSEKFRASYSGQ